MSTIWNWSPVINAASDWIDRRKQQSLLDTYMGQPQAVPKDVTLGSLSFDRASLNAGGANGSSIPNGGHPVTLPQSLSLAMPSVNGTYPAGTPVTYDGPLGKLMGTMPAMDKSSGGVGSALMPLLQQLTAGPSEEDEEMPDPFVAPARPRANPARIQMRPFQPPSAGVAPPVISLLNSGRFTKS